MNFKEGQTVELNTLHASVTGTITKVMRGHAIVCFKSINEGVRLAVKPTGALVMLGGKDELEPHWTLLNIGDIEAVPLADLCAVEETKLAPEWITREQAEHWLGKYSDTLDSFIEKGTIKQSIDGLLRAADVKWASTALPTYEANITKEQNIFGDKPKEFNRLGRELHPQIFGKAW